MKKLFVCLLMFLRLSVLFAEEQLSLSFIGDVMAHDVNFRIRQYEPVYRNVREMLLKDDLTFANLEFPVNQQMEYATYPRFNVQRDYVQAVIEAGGDVFSLANNHSYDKGMDGIYQTLASLIMLKEAGSRKIYFSGTRGNLKQPFKPVTILKKGFKIGFIALTAFSNRYLEKLYLNIVNYNDQKAAEEFLALVAAESVKYDLFIVSYHAGAEYRYTPLAAKEQYFKQILAAGAHIVYGHHPHVLQPVEIVKNGSLNKLIIYSAGNFISGQRWYGNPPDIHHYRSYTGDSAIFQVQVKKTDLGVTVADISLELITNHIDDRRQVVVEKYSDILAKALPEKWQKYYRERYKLMQQFLPGNSIIN